MKANVQLITNYEDFDFELNLDSLEELFNQYDACKTVVFQFDNDSTVWIRSEDVQYIIVKYLEE